PFVAEHDRRAIILVAQEVLREIELRAGKPACAGHAVGIGEYRLPGTRRTDPAELPDHGPEAFRMPDREIVQCRIVREVVAAGTFPCEAQESVEVRAFDTIAARFPDRLFAQGVFSMCQSRSEERRVGKEGRGRGTTVQLKEKEISEVKRRRRCNS